MPMWSFDVDLSLSFSLSLFLFLSFSSSLSLPLYLCAIPSLALLFLIDKQGQIWFQRCQIWLFQLNQTSLNFAIGQIYFDVFFHKHTLFTFYRPHCGPGRQLNYFIRAMGPVPETAGVISAVSACTNFTYP